MSAVTGERSSWLTSLAKRTSRSMRDRTASTMSLNDRASRASSGSRSSSSLVSRPPEAISPAALATRRSGPSTPRLMVKPSRPAATVMRVTPTESVVAMVARVLRTESSGNASK